MKKIFTVTILVLMACAASAQKDYKVVIDLTSRDSLSQAMAMRWAAEIINAEPTAQVEIVMYGPGTALVIKDRSMMSDKIAQVVGNKNISFKVCEVALANQKVDKSQLLPGVQTVPDGIYEIVSKQRQGWGYIKVAH
jgi:uncharacterized protein